MKQSSEKAIMKCWIAAAFVLFTVTWGMTPPPGLTCGPSENPGTCIPECPCQGQQFHCDVYDEQCAELNNGECCCYEPTDELPTLCTGEEPPGTSCGPNDNPGECELGCPCEDTRLHCANFDDQCTVLDDPKPCCCYDENDTPPDVCYT